MKLASFAILTVLSASCSTMDRQNKVTREVQEPNQLVSLPKLRLDGVDFDDGLAEHEAVTASSAYFHRFVSSCGMPDKPRSGQDYWMVQLLGGFVATDYGQLWLSKNGNEVLLLPPRNGFKTVTKRLLKHESPTPR